MWLKAALLYLLAINIVAFLLYGSDKRRALSRSWRIPEKALIDIALAGGSAGAIAGMYAFRHKTKHWYFRYGLPVILFVQILVLCFLIKGMYGG